MEHPPTLQPPAFSDTTPTRAEALRACPLRAAFDASPVHRAHVIRGPAARLGTVCHDVLEAAARGYFDGMSDEERQEAFEQLWHQRMTDAAVSW